MDRIASRRTVERALALVVMACVPCVVMVGAGEGDWAAPARAARRTSPVAASAESVAAGRAVFQKECRACHGEAGKGDGPKAATLDKNPGDLTADGVQSQSDGALFWKITEGRSPMPATKSLLTDDQRWQVVTYLRTLAATPATPPQYEADGAVRAGVSAVFQKYNAARAALAAPSPDLAALAKAVEGMRGAVESAAKVPTDGLGVEARAAWEKSRQALDEACESLRSTAGDAAKARVSFARVSGALSTLISEFGHDEAGSIAVYSEPTSGRVWLQSGGAPASPYGSDVQGVHADRTLGAARPKH
ncbi:MAG: cytochrome c [Phycisphaerales bacterium]